MMAYIPAMFFPVIYTPILVYDPFSVLVSFRKSPLSLLALNVNIGEYYKHDKKNETDLCAFYYSEPQEPRQQEFPQRLCVYPTNPSECVICTGDTFIYSKTPDIRKTILHSILFASFALLAIGLVTQICIGCHDCCYSD